MELYDALLFQVTNSPTTNRLHLDKLRGDILSLDTEGHTFIFALIYYHSLMNHLIPPSLAETVVIDLDLLPKILSKIIGKFIEMHKQHMMEERQREHLVN